MAEYTFRLPAMKVWAMETIVRSFFLYARLTGFISRSSLKFRSIQSPPKQRILRRNQVGQSTVGWFGVLCDVHDHASRPFIDPHTDVTGDRCFQTTTCAIMSTPTILSPRRSLPHTMPDVLSRDIGPLESPFRFQRDNPPGDPRGKNRDARISRCTGDITIKSKTSIAVSELL